MYCGDRLARGDALIGLDLDEVLEDLDCVPVQFEGRLAIDLPPIIGAERDALRAEFLAEIERETENERRAKLADATFRRNQRQRTTLRPARSAAPTVRQWVHPADALDLYRYEAEIAQLTPGGVIARAERKLADGRPETFVNCKPLVAVAVVTKAPSHGLRAWVVDSGVGVARQ